MSAVEKIKAATAKLNPDEQYELFRWWIELETFRQRQLAALKRDIAVGIEHWTVAAIRFMTRRTRCSWLKMSDVLAGND